MDFLHEAVGLVEDLLKGAPALPGAELPGLSPDRVNEGGEDVHGVTMRCRVLDPTYKRTPSKGGGSFNHH